MRSHLSAVAVQKGSGEGPPNREAVPARAARGPADGGRGSASRRAAGLSPGPAALAPALAAAEVRAVPRRGF